MGYCLIDPAGRVAQVVATAEDTFPVASPLVWVNDATGTVTPHGWRYDRQSGKFSETPAPSRPVTWTSLEFMERFTPAERKSVRQAAHQNDDLADWLDLLRAAQVVDPTDDRTVAGMDALVTAGLLTAARKAEIMETT